MTRVRLRRTPSRADLSAKGPEPLTTGLPFPKGALGDAGELSLAAGGQVVPVQARALDHWSDGSVRWVLLDAQVTEAQAQAGLELRTGGPEAGSVRDLVAGERPGEVTIDTGALRIVCDTRHFPFASVTGDGAPRVDPSTSGLLVRNAAGETGSLRVTSVAVAERGSIRAAVSWTGLIAGPSGQPWIDVFATAHFFAGSPAVRLAITLRNPRRAHHPENFWELGDAGSFLIGEAALTLGAPADAAGTAPAVGYSRQRGEPMAWGPGPVSVYQEGSGGDRWQGRAHVNRAGVVPVSRRGFVARLAGVDTAGDRATPIVAVRSAGWSLAATAEYFWENCPRSLDASPAGLTLGLFPAAFSDAIELQGGEQKTHEWTVAFGPEGGELPLVWGRSPAVLHADPAWYCASGALGTIDPQGLAPAHDALVNQAVDGADTFLSKRERIDEYGWRHFGDIYADHEAVFHAGADPLVSHYNNQYDAVAGFALQFMRTGDVRWWLQMRELAAHVADIDLYHTDEDKSAYSRGLFWHTFHYVDAGRSTHRAYPPAPGVPGGGPSNEHNYNTGFLLHHFVTGSQASRDAALQLAHWVVQIDDGRLTPFRLIDRGPTGAASSTADVRYHGPGRGAGNSIVALLNGYRLSGDESLFAKAEALVRRCIHPDDDVAALDLLDAERRWSYTVFLQALGRYLDECAERGRLGDGYRLARESLLRYARWMQAFEYPYLETPQKLEYPTETWAAQDIRKADVLAYAARHAPAGEREALRERAAFFFRYATDTLAHLPTRSLARPVVILLSNGLVAARELREPVAPAPEPDPGARRPGRRRPFAPQRVRAVRRAATLAAAAAAALAAFLILASCF